MKNTHLCCLFAIVLAAKASTATVSDLFARGYTVLPAPQIVKLEDSDFVFDDNWRLALGPGVSMDDIAVQTLSQQLAERFQLKLAATGRTDKTVLLQLAPGSIAVANTTDWNTAALSEQAYAISLHPGRIIIRANTNTGLFYGVETLVQLLKPVANRFQLPAGEIEDWPDLELRTIYWDDAHHLEKLDVLKAAIHQAAFYKINGFSIKLEGHFQYTHAPAVVDPYALSPAQLQELTDYALRYHIQLIPYLDGPAHDAFILKHPEYAALREYPDSNYELCAVNPDTYKLLNSMFDDLLAANKGSRYVVLSTDEAYYIGLADIPACREAERAHELGSVGKLLAEFVTKIADRLHAAGREIIFWGEFPMKPDDIPVLPSYLINGEVYGPLFDPVFRAHGIRQMIYTSAEGEEPMFPQYYILPSTQRLHPAPADQQAGRLQEIFEQNSLTSHQSLSSTRPDSAQPHQADIMGSFLAGWADPGIHPETFWLGYAAGSASAWHRGFPDPGESESTFYRLFYGADTIDMARLYQLMSEQAQFWRDSWEIGPSAARTPIWGESYGIFHPPVPAHDQYLPQLPIPTSPLLHLTYNWLPGNEKRLALAADFLARNDELIGLLRANLEQVRFNRYNLEVFLSIANLYRQNLLLLRDLGRISNALEDAEASAGSADAPKAIASLDLALDTAQSIRRYRNEVLQDATATWYKSWLPRVSEANGRSYLNVVDDVKDHPPNRTADMSYLVYRELLYPLQTWADEVLTVRNQYATAHGMPKREFKLDWTALAPGNYR